MILFFLVGHFLFFGKIRRDKGLCNVFKWTGEKLVFDTK